ncbi:hypothetical protein [Streptomyces sp. NPDC058664]|uniref:hypothetical protein n=1 Tax=unclassified Streptomyces TaxID=2593676 RepID=UPI0036616102
MDVKDLIERSGFTGLEAGVAVAITQLGEVSVWWAAPLALVLTALKVWVSGRIRPKEAA